MGRVTNITRQLYSPVRQAWKDYKVGRMMRKSKRQELEQLECKGNETQPRPTKSSPPRGWQFDRTAEFPWCLQQVVQEESNWRGTWILEVKDMQGMEWGTVLVPKESGSGGKYQRRPTKHLPFTPETQQDDSIVLSDGGQDDLMVWLGKR
jgi:hypothetical protein